MSLAESLTPGADTTLGNKDAAADAALSTACCTVRLCALSACATAALRYGRRVLGLARSEAAPSAFASRSGGMLLAHVAETLAGSFSRCWKRAWTDTK